MTKQSFGQIELEQAQSFKFNLDVDNIKSQLVNVSKLEVNGDGKSQASQNGIELQIPLPNGTYLTYYLLEAPILSKELAKEYSFIKTYKAFEANGESLGRIITFGSEIRGFFVTGFGNVIVQPSTSTGGNYESLFERSDGVMENCLIKGANETEEKTRKSFGISGFSNGSILKTYKIAVVTTGEFFTNNGASQPLAMAEVTNTIAALSTLYETEVGVSFTLTGVKIYEDAASDPFDPGGTDPAYQSGDAFAALAISEPGTFGYSEYDIGHTLHYSAGGGGQALLSQVCAANKNKASGWSGVSPTYRATLYHEVAHQFSAGHTFNSIQNGCNGNIMTGSAFEPGSGSTIMSYSGSCSPDNLSGANGFSRSYFHTNSLESIISFSANFAICYTSSASGNTAPIVDANPSGNPIVIPKETPFVLSGTGSDSETLNYTWEQYDLGDTRGGADDVAASTDSPIFRSFEPTEGGNVRTFPKLNAILNGNLPSNDEALPTVARTINMRLTARDNNATSGGTTSDDVAITVADSGPFRVTVGNSPTLWFQGETKAITWDVNGTDAAPVNCSNVNILISTDGGDSFSSLVANTSNDGIDSITVPNNPSSEVRLKVEAVNNIFFDINDQNITISDGSCIAGSSLIVPDNGVTYMEGSANLNFDLAAHGDTILAFDGTLESEDLFSNLSYKDTGGGCAGPSNPNYNDVFTFYVSQAGEYEFTYSGDFGLVMNLYSGEYNSSSVCSNWLTSSAEKNPNENNVILSYSISYTLPVGTYQIVMSSFNASFPALPSSYTINVTQGTIYTPIPELGSPYDYTYLACDTTSGLIKAFDALADFRSLSSGAFKIYGLYFAGGADLSTYLETAFINLEEDIDNSAFCGKLSVNNKELVVADCPGIPDAPAVADTIIDYGETGLLTAIGCSGTVNWFEMETGGLSIFTGSSFESPALTETKTYYASCTETCESTTRASAVITVIPLYCDVSGLNCLEDDIINNVTLTFSLNELFSESSECGSNGFTLYDKSEINLVQGETYNLSVSKLTEWPDGLAVWFDFNGNHIFEESEKVWTESVNSIETQSYDITIPENASIGQIRMRVKIEYNSEVTGACQSETESVYGEVEDYIFSIVAPSTPCDSNVVLVSPEHDFSSGTTHIQTSEGITGSNNISGGSIIYDAGKSVELLPGFVVNLSEEDSGVFLAEIGGCE